jgi:predicted Zn-dependent protease
MSLLLWKNYSLEYFGVWLGLKYSKSFKKKREKFFRMLGQMAIVLSLILITISADQNAFAYTPSSQHEYLDFQPYTGNRLIVFNDTRIDYCITNNQENPAFNYIAANAVKTWHDRIVEVTNNPFVWDMTLHIDPKNESICDGFVNYVDTPDPTIFQLSGVAGFSHPLTPVANVTIYTDDYQSTLLDMAKNDKNFWKTLTLEKFEDIIKNENHKQLDYDVINRITLHEIGHSLSLNHPFTSDGNLQNAKGVMGYNMTYNQIEDEEVIKIVKAYPNGFSLRTLPDSIKLDEPNRKQIVHLGEVTNLTIELPRLDGKLPPSGLEVYIFPEGTASQKPDYAPVKILKTNGMNHLVNDGEYFEDIHVSMTHWDTFSKVLSVQFKVVKEFENADMVIVSHSVGGFEKQWFLDDIMTVEKALFSNLLLDIETTDYTYHLMGVNPNRILEEEKAFQHEQKQLYTEALAGCLKDKNMKKCNDEIAFEDFKQDKEDVPIWMPLTLMMK